MKAAATDLWIVGLITAVGCAHLHAADLMLLEDEKPNAAIVTAGDSLAPDNPGRLVGPPATIAARRRTS
jgi:hypothetical protein